MSRADQARIKAVREARKAIRDARDKVTFGIFKDALARCHGNIQELARRMGNVGDKNLPFSPTTIYGWKERGGVPFVYRARLQKILKAPRNRHRGRARAEARAA